MSFQARLVLVVMWVLSIIGVGMWASAQSRIPRRPTVGAPILSGTDIGFALDSVDGGAAIGRWKIRVNGEWHDVMLTDDVIKGRGRVVPLGGK